MDLKQLRYFVQIADSRSITAAAVALYISQPALSQHILKLESALGTRVLDRSATGISLTSSGKILYRYAVAILRSAADAENSVRGEAAAPGGHVAVGMPSSTARAIAVPLLERALSDLPSVMLELVETPSADLETLVMQGRLDMALSTGGERCRGVKSKVLVDEKLYILAHRDFGLAPAGITLRELAHLPLIMPSAPNALRTKLDEAFRARELTCNLIAESSSTTIMVAAVKRKLCVTMLPLSSVPASVGYEEITAVELLDAHISRQIFITTSELAPLSLAGEKVELLIGDIVCDAIDAGQWKGATYISSAA